MVGTVIPSITQLEFKKKMDLLEIKKYMFRSITGHHQVSS